VGAPTVISELVSNFFPRLPVSCTGTCQGVSHFVEEDLMHIVIAFSLRKVAREGDAFGLMVALAKTSLSVVKIKRPVIAV